MQYAALEDVPMFKIRADEGADKEKQQCLLLGASSVTHMMKAVCNREEGEKAIYYMSKPGSTVEDMYKALKKALENKSFFLADDHCDREIFKQTGMRPLLILVYMTLNDLNAILDAEYLTDTMEAFRQLITRFQANTRRQTRISFTSYMYAPSRRDNHGKLSEMNAIIDKANKEVFNVATYDPNSRLLRPVKTGRPGNVTLIKPDGEHENFHTDTSITGNWILPGAYHVSDKKLREIIKDVRIFFELGMQEPNSRPWDAYDLDVEIDLKETIPKFNPGEEYPSLNTASLYATRAANNGGNRKEGDSQRQPGDRTLGDFVEAATDDQRDHEGDDREKSKRSRQSKNRDQVKKRPSMDQEERRHMARQAARQRTKERVRGATADKEKMWQEIKDKAETVRPPTDARVHIEAEVASLSVGTQEGSFIQNDNNLNIR